MLTQRLDTHISNRISEKQKHYHWCLEWARKIFLKYQRLWYYLTKKYISNILITNSEAKFQCTYLYYDTNDEIWVRSGKVSHRDFSIRHNKHQKVASSLDTKSRFYCRYPSKIPQYISIVK